MDVSKSRPSWTPLHNVGPMRLEVLGGNPVHVTIEVDLAKLLECAKRAATNASRHTRRGPLRLTAERQVAWDQLAGATSGHA